MHLDLYEPMNVPFRPQLPISTQRLSLRSFRTDDLDDFHAIESHPEVVRYLYWETRSREESLEELSKKSSQTQIEKADDRISLAVEWPEVGRVVGYVVLICRSIEHSQGEIGFVFNPEFQGKGLAREAAAVTLDVGFRQVEFHRIFGRCDARNLASARLMERLGMRREAHFIHDEIFKGEWGDQLVYAMLQSEWLTRGTD